MFFGKKINVRSSWEDTPNDFNEIVDFLNWFDRTTSVEDTIAKAVIDWKFRFQKFPYFKKINKYNALEIGFGGGRLLSQSCKLFKKVYGIDIHKNFLMSKIFLNKNGIDNFELLHRNKINLIPNHSIDLVYSFIVFQHFDSIKEVDFYLYHIKRLLAPEGVAHIYFGKNKSKGIKATSSNEFNLRDCSLFINPLFMKDKINNEFKIIEFKEDLARNVITQTGESVQSMIIFKNKIQAQKR